MPPKWCLPTRTLGSLRAEALFPCLWSSIRTSQSAFCSGALLKCGLLINRQTELWKGVHGSDYRETLLCLLPIQFSLCYTHIFFLSNSAHRWAFGNQLQSIEGKHLGSFCSIKNSWPEILGASNLPSPLEYPLWTKAYTKETNSFFFTVYPVPSIVPRT